VLQRLAESGLELTACERRALASLDVEALLRFADGIDGRLQKSDLKNGTAMTSLDAARARAREESRDSRA
jgi:hypothetical protein